MRFKYYLRGAGIGVIVATLILAVAFLFHDNISDEEVIRRAIRLGMVMEENTPGTLADFQQSGATAVDLETGADDQQNANGGTSDSGNDQNTDGAFGQGASDADGSPAGQSDNQKSDESGISDKDPLNPDDTSDQHSNDDAGQNSNQNSEHDSGTASDGNSDKSGSNKKDTNKKDTNKKDSDKNNSDKKDADAGTAEPDSKPSEADAGNSDEQSNEVEIVIEAGDVSRMVSAKVFEAGLVESADEFNSYLGAHGYDNMLQPGTYKITKGSSFRQIARILTTR